MKIIPIISRKVKVFITFSNHRQPPKHRCRLSRRDNSYALSENISNSKNTARSEENESCGIFIGGFRIIERLGN